MDPGNEPTKTDINAGGSAGGNVTVGNHNQIFRQTASKPINDTGTFLSLARNTLFTGRETALAELAAALTGDTNVVITQAITGMGGIGKSQLALEFAYRSADNFVSAHWLNLADPTQLNTEIAACGRLMGIDYDSQPEQVGETLRVWAQRGPRLLVLDNYEETADAPQTLSPLLNLSTVRLLITSRQADFPPEMRLRACALEAFTPEDSLAFLRKLVEYSDDQIPGLEKLAETLGHLPLALHLAGRYLREEHITPAEYLRELGLASPASHQQSLLATLTLSWQKVDDEIAQQVFKLAGYLAPNTPIPLSIFEKTIFDDSGDDHSATNASNIPKGRAAELSNPGSSNILSVSIESSSAEALTRKHVRLVIKAISRLKDLGLLTVTDLPQIHPLLAAYARHLNAESSESLDKLADKLAALARQANIQVDQSGRLTWFAPLQAHVLVVAEQAEKADLQTAASLYNSLGYHLKTIADYSTARSAFERAIRIWETGLGEDDPNVATSLNNLGEVLRVLGDLNDARAAFERTIQIWEDNSGSNDPNVASGVNNLGLALQDQGDLNGARAAFERAIQIWEISLGKNHPKVAIAVNNLGTVLQSLGDLTGARAAFERALKIGDTTPDKNHPDIAARINDLGRVLQALGDLNGARAAFERAIQIWEANLGENHPQVASGVNNLGGVLKALGDPYPTGTMSTSSGRVFLKEARAAFERALKIDEAAFGPAHPQVAADVLNVGAVFQAQGQKGQARVYYKHALAIYEQSLPAEHPNIEKAKMCLKSLDG